MVWFGNNFIKFVGASINSIMLLSTKTCSSARFRGTWLDIRVLITLSISSSDPFVLKDFMVEQTWCNHLPQKCWWPWNNQFGEDFFILKLKLVLLCQKWGDRRGPKVPKNWPKIPKTGSKKLSVSFKTNWHEQTIPHMAAYSLTAFL